MYIRATGPIHLQNTVRLDIYGIDVDMHTNASLKAASMSQLNKTGYKYEQPQYYICGTEVRLSSLSFSLIPMGRIESSDENEGVRTPSRICACVRGERPRLNVDPFRFRCCGVSCPDAVLPRRGRLDVDEREGGRSSISTGVVLRDEVREWDSDRVWRRDGTRSLDIDGW